MDKFKQFLEKLYAEEYANLYESAFLMLGDLFLAEDAVEEVFVTIICHRRWWTQQSESERVRYAKKICLATCKKILKKRDRFFMMGYMDDVGEGDDSSDMKRSLIEQGEDLKIALSFLKKEDRAIFEDKYFNGLTHKAIANKYGISENLVAKRLERGRILLRSKIQ